MVNILKRATIYSSLIYLDRYPSVDYFLDNTIKAFLSSSGAPVV